MSDDNGTPAGWYPSEGGERYWNGSAWTEQTRPVGQQQAAPVAYAQPPGHQPKKKHTLRWVLLALVLLFVLFVGDDGGEIVLELADVRARVPQHVIQRRAARTSRTDGRDGQRQCRRGSAKLPHHAYYDVPLAARAGGRGHPAFDAGRRPAEASDN